MKKLLMLALFLGLASFSHAMPGMTSKEDASKAKQGVEEKYKAMDTNNDNKVGAEEFKKAYPQMTEAVFGIIDLDKDASISRDEWMKFQAKHMQGMKEEEGKHAPSSGKMLITPPKDAK